MAKQLPSAVATTAVVDVSSLIECPICFDHILPPILQCRNGHVVCRDCRQKFENCSVCRVHFSTQDIRNLALEKMAANVSLPCNYSDDGCTTLPLYNEKMDHEKICDFRPVLCPFPLDYRCQWQGAYSLVVEHLTTAHGLSTVVVNTTGTYPLSIIVNCYWPHFYFQIISYFGHQFVMNVFYDGLQRYFGNILLIGSMQDAEQFTYRLELNGQHQQRLTWNAKIQSIRERKLTSSYYGREHYGFTIDHAQANYFADNGQLVINVTISKSNTQ